MELTKQEISVLIEILGQVSLPVNTTNQVINPIIEKLRRQMEVVEKETK